MGKTSAGHSFYLGYFIFYLIILLGTLYSVHTQANTIEKVNSAPSLLNEQKIINTPSEHIIQKDFIHTYSLTFSLGFIIIGTLFILLEGFTPTSGLIGAVGAAIFIIGSLILMTTQHPFSHAARLVIWSMAFANFFILAALILVTKKTRQQKIKNGLLMLVGAQGRALDRIDLEGQAVIRGEIWSVHSKSPIAKDRLIKVIHASGLLLEVVEEENIKPGRIK